MNQSPSEAREDRVRYLCVAWYAADCQERSGVDQRHIGEALELDAPAIRSITDYLIGEDLIQPASLGGTIWLRHNGRYARKLCMGRKKQPAYPW